MAISINMTIPANPISATHLLSMSRHPPQLTPFISYPYRCSAPFAHEKRICVFFSVNGHQYGFSCHIAAALTFFHALSFLRLCGGLEPTPPNPMFGMLPPQISPGIFTTRITAYSEHYHVSVGSSTGASCPLSEYFSDYIRNLEQNSCAFTDKILVCYASGIMPNYKHNTPFCDESLDGKLSVTSASYSGHFEYTTIKIGNTHIKSGSAAPTSASVYN